MNGYIAKCEGVFKINGETKSPNKGQACLREVVNRTRPIRGMFSRYDEPESPNEGAWSRHIMYLGHLIKGAA